MFICRISRHPFGAYAALLLLQILSTHHRCSARQITNDCAPFSCGNFLNISSPFRLNTDRGSCGDRFIELGCEDNVRLTLNLNMVKYYVEAINYSDSTIRLVDPAVQKDYIMDTSSCKNGSGTAQNSSPSCVNMEGHSYVMVDGLMKDVPDLCRVNLMYDVPKNVRNMSYRDVHDILADGLELGWYIYSYTEPYPLRSLSDLYVEGIVWIVCRTDASSCFYRHTTPPVLLSFLMLFLPAILALLDLQLIGFSVKGSKRALIYEFMPNGSLERYIFSRQGSVPLSNEKLYEISLGVARGIEYLHQGCDMQILHFDIKPHNILLDEKFIPKVSDFGLAKLYPTNNNSVPLTAARGTIGYMAPELFYKNIGGVSYKADVYSYGMLLMEMVGRRKNLNAMANHSSQLYFPSWAYDQVNEGKDIEDATEHEKKTTTKMIIVALWCIQLKPVDRPSMHKVVEMLESDVESLRMPPKPFFTPHQVQEDDYRANNTKLSDPPNDMDSSYQFGR